MINFKFNGTEQFSRKLKKTVNGQVVKKVIHADGVKLQETSKRMAPVDTGNLKRMIRNYIEEDGYQNRTASEAEYAVSQEKGTRSQSGTPHIKPAFDATKNQFIKDMKGVLSDE